MGIGAVESAPPLAKGERIRIMEVEQVEIINKGIEYPLIASGNEFIVGTEYTCTLYRSAKDESNRASVVVTAQEIGGIPTCAFVFSPTQTASLKTGDVILEIYDNVTLKQMVYKEGFAQVRATSIAQ